MNATLKVRDLRPGESMSMKNWEVDPDVLVDMAAWLIPHDKNTIMIHISMKVEVQTAIAKKEGSK